MRSYTEESHVLKIKKPMENLNIGMLLPRVNF